MDNLKQLALSASSFLPTYGGSSVVYNTGGQPSQLNNANDVITRLASLGDVAVYPPLSLWLSSISSMPASATS